MSALVGIDIQSIDEVATSLTRFGSRYTRRLFTPLEIECYGEDPATAPRCFAACFAVKEAVLKILDVREDVPPWKSIELLPTTSGKAQIVLTGKAEDLAQRQEINKFSLDICHGVGVVLATVLAQGGVRSLGGRH